MLSVVLKNTFCWKMFPVYGTRSRAYVYTQLLWHLCEDGQFLEFSLMQAKWWWCPPDMTQVLNPPHCSNILHVTALSIVLMVKNTAPTFLSNGWSSRSLNASGVNHNTWWIPSCFTRLIHLIKPRLCVNKLSIPRCVRNIKARTAWGSKR